ncbi:hypothetical protein [Anabaena lutea]|uniref:Uncharacterized protein n=1 Tax=Anabaena lutea FACHB-196 TaxID=2692881 RepID=A0ABR8FD27_9NOST|nr:hypothetical protein [Anabaena lutea]MBD2567859.1 hypothetical protein [Anabaena lutea FACHB-196]
MDYSSLRTAAEIINAFRECQNAGEQIDLFEALAISDPPPVEAFVEILKNIKLEAVVALTIQAFGKIKDADTRERLKQSDDLLAILSEQAQSGKTDLICWSAATTIENLKFDFIAVSRHLTVEPKSLAEKIVQGKIKRIGDKNLLSSNDFGDYLNFWIYGDLEKLRSETASIKAQGQNFTDIKKTGLGVHALLAIVDNSKSIIIKVFNALFLRAIRETNQALQRAENMGSSASEVDENELFELVACQEAYSQIINPSVSKENIAILVETQVHCLQSNNSNTRKIAADNLSKIDGSLLSNFNQYYQPDLLTAISLIQEEFNSNKRSTSYYTSNLYKKLKDMANNLVTMLPTLHRNKVKNDCQLFLNNLRNEINTKKELCENRYKATLDLKSNLDKQLEQIQSTNFLVYTKIIVNNTFNTIPYINIEENDQYDLILDNYLQYLHDELSRSKYEVNKFYKGYIQDKLAPLDKKIDNEQANLEQINLLLKISPFASFIMAFLIHIMMHWGGIIIGSIILGVIFEFVAIQICGEFFEGSQKSRRETISKKSSEQHRLNDEKQKILNLLSI